MIILLDLATYDRILQEKPSIHVSKIAGRPAHVRHRPRPAVVDQREPAASRGWPQEVLHGLRRLGPLPPAAPRSQGVADQGAGATGSQLCINIDLNNIHTGRGFKVNHRLRECRR